MGLGPNVGGSEDCLFLDVYAPTEANKTSKLPVYVFIQGGGFNGDGAHPNASGLISACDMNIVTVTFLYRGGALGFLASKEVESGASLNNGLKDQRKALQWVQSNIVAVRYYHTPQSQRKATNNGYSSVGILIMSPLVAKVQEQAL